VSNVAVKSGYALATMGERRFYVKVVGVDEYFWDINDFKTYAGRFFTPADVRNRRRVCVLGQEVARKIFGHKNVTGRLLPIDNDVYRVVGVLGGVDDNERARWAFLPITTASDRILNFGLPDLIYLRCDTWDDVEHVVSAIPRTVGLHQPTTGFKQDVAWGALKQVRRTSNWIELFIYLSVTATLFLGGFGIWNIMMGSIQARTREIGLKKAMGAEDRDILAQFLAEALTLSLGAAVLGILLGRLVVEILALLINSRPSEDVFFMCVGFSFLFSILIGCGAGLYPSIKASRMEVVSAMSFE